MLFLGTIDCEITWLPFQPEVGVVYWVKKVFEENMIFFFLSYREM